MIKNHYGIAIDSNKAITGVININSVNMESLNDDMYYGSGVNLTFEDCLSDHIKFCEDENCIEDDHNNFSENYYSDNDTYIVNFIKDNKGLYTPDMSKDYSFIVRESVLQIVYSKFYKLCSLCSPCYPGQGDLNSIGSYLTYCLSIDYFDDDSVFDTSKILTNEDIKEK